MIEPAEGDLVTLIGFREGDLFLVLSVDLDHRYALEITVLDPRTCRRMEELFWHREAYLPGDPTEEFAEGNYNRLIKRSR
jgi:hypothetical protein